MPLTLASIAVGAAFAVAGALAERLASAWPPDEARHRGPSWRTGALAAVSGAAAAAVVLRSSLPWWATACYLGLLGLMLVLTATDLEQRRLPHVLLAARRVGMRSYIPFGPFLVAGAVLALLIDDRALSVVR